MIQHSVKLPAKKITEVQVQMSVLPKAVFQRRIETLRARMAENGIDCLIAYSDIWRSNNVAYLTDYRQGGGGIGQSWTALLLPIEGRPSIFVGFEEIGCCQDQIKIDADIQPSTQFETVLRAYAQAHRPSKIGLAGTPIVLHAVYACMERSFPAAEIVDCDRMIARDRWVKEAAEIEAIARAFERSDRAISEVLSAVKEGVTERELFAIGTASLARQQCELAFIPTVAIGGNAGIAMKRPSDKRLQSGDLIMLDFGAIFEGYTSDTTRTVGYHVDDPFERGILDAALAGRKAGLDVIRPGLPFSKLEWAVRDAISEKGYGAYLLHNVGHGLGIDSSEEDLPIGPDSQECMQVGMVFTVEPGIYVPGIGGCRIEECVVVTEDGYEVFSKLPAEPALP